MRTFIFRRYLLILGAVTLAVLAVFSGYVYESGRNQLREADRQRVSLLAEVIRNGLRAIMLEGRAREFQKFIDSIIAEDVETVRVFSESGVVLNSSIPSEIGRKVDTAHVTSFGGMKGEAVFMRRDDGKEVYSTFWVIDNDWPCQKCHGRWGKIRGILDIEVSTVQSNRAIGDLRKKIALGFFAAALVMLGSLIVLHRRFVVRPVSRIAEHLGEMPETAVGRPAVAAVAGPEAVHERIDMLRSGIDDLRGQLAWCEQERVRQDEKMSALGDVAAAVAHEIKNPLAGISGALQVMSEDIPYDNPRKAICYEILEEIERLDAAVKDFLLYARQPELHLLHADINAIIEKVQERLVGPAAKAGVRIALEAAEPSPEILVDPDQIETVFVSICMHQIRQMPSGGVLTIRNEGIQDGAMLRIACSDTGRTIPAEQLALVFKPFFSTRQLGGGLKLAICKNVVESHGGRISVSSRPGAGTTFLIDLPADR